MTQAAPAPRPAIDFGRSFTFVREDPDWIRKLLLGGVFTFLCAVLVGIPFVFGYFSRTLRSVVCGASPALPEWDDFGGLFEEGLRLAALYLLHVLAVLVVFGGLAAVVVLPLIAVSGSGEPSDALAAISGLGLLGLYAAIMVAALLVAIYLPAALARAALASSLSHGLDWRANLEFIRANLANYALALVSYLLASFLAQLGFLLCCVGVFPAAFWGYLVLARALGETVRLSPVRLA